MPRNCIQQPTNNRRKHVNIFIFTFRRDKHTRIDATLAKTFTRKVLPRGTKRSRRKIDRPWAGHLSSIVCLLVKTEQLGWTLRRYNTSNPHLGTLSRYTQTIGPSSLVYTLEEGSPLTDGFLSYMAADVLVQVFWQAGRLLYISQLLYGGLDYDVVFVESRLQADRLPTISVLSFSASTCLMNMLGGHVPPLRLSPSNPPLHLGNHSC